MDQICLCVADAQILSNKPELHASLWQNHPNRRKWNPDKFGTQTVIDQRILQWGKLTISGTCNRQDKIFSSLTLRINILAGEDCFFNYFFFFALNFFWPVGSINMIWSGCQLTQSIGRFGINPIIAGLLRKEKKITNWICFG